MQFKTHFTSLKADASRQGILTGMRDMRFPGSVLLKVGLGKDSIARLTLWAESRRRLEQIEKKRTNKITRTATTEEREEIAGSSSADEESEDDCGRYSLSGKKVSCPLLWVLLIGSSSSLYFEFPRIGAILFACSHFSMQKSS